MNSAERAKCWIRVRPTAKFASRMIKVQNDHKTVNIFFNKERRGSIDRGTWSFSTDGILHNTSQEVVYETVAEEMVKDAMNGYNGTLMCYGQTGSGKTYTMTGSLEKFHNRGIVPRALSQMFRDARMNDHMCYTFMVSHFEIYNENIYDLLVSKCDKQQQFKSLKIFDTDCGATIKELKIVHVHNKEEAINLFFEGQINRVKSAHVLNECSSRSHSIFTIYINSYSKVDSNPNFMASKLNLVDLAGSERISKNQSLNGVAREEATYINKTLLFLEHVISAFAEPGRSHVPFRQSRLTLFLRDSIGGCCHTRLIGNIRAEAEHIEETLSTLRFAMSMMGIKVKPVVQCRADPYNQIKCLEDDLTRLKKELYLHDVLADRRDVSYDPLTLRQKEDIKKMVKGYIEGSMEEIEVINLLQLKEVFKYFKNFSNEAIQDLDAAYRNQYILIDRFDPKVLDLARAAGVLPALPEGQTKNEVVTADVSYGEKDKIKKSLMASQQKLKSSKVVQSPQKTADAEQTIQTGEEEEEEEEDGGRKVEEVIGYKVEPVVESAPPRNEQFEVYKMTIGCELNKSLVNNKNLLASKKKEHVLMAREANKLKENIDSSQCLVNCMRCCRQFEGLTYNESGELIITESEYLEVLKLSDLKNSHRGIHETINNLKCEILYCQNAVDQSRRKLLHEFDFWYFNKFAHILANKDQAPNLHFNICNNLTEVVDAKFNNQYGGVVS